MIEPKPGDTLQSVIEQVIRRLDELGLEVKRIQAHANAQTEGNAKLHAMVAQLTEIVQGMDERQDKALRRQPIMVPPVTLRRQRWPDEEAPAERIEDTGAEPYDPEQDCCDGYSKVCCGGHDER